MKILAIDTSNQSLAVAICDGDKAVGNYLATTNKNHSVALMPAIDVLMKNNSMTPQDIDRIVVAKGPGSYTGLRIGVTTAKTLAWTLGIELVGISSLATLAANSIDYQGYIVPLFDARRQNVYTGVYQWQNEELVCIKEERHIALSEWLELLVDLEKEIRFVGIDVFNFFDEIVASFGESVIPKNPNAHAINGLALAKLGAKALPEKNIEDFVPSYLKLVEAEEKWLANNKDQGKDYVRKI